MRARGMKFPWQRRRFERQLGAAMERHPELRRGALIPSGSPVLLVMSPSDETKCEVVFLYEPAGLEGALTYFATRNQAVEVLRDMAGRQLASLGEPCALCGFTREEHETMEYWEDDPAASPCDRYTEEA